MHKNDPQVLVNVSIQTKTALGFRLKLNGFKTFTHADLMTVTSLTWWRVYSHVFRTTGSAKHTHLTVKLKCVFTGRKSKCVSMVCWYNWLIHVVQSASPLPHTHTPHTHNTHTHTHTQLISTTAGFLYFLSLCKGYTRLSISTHTQDRKNKKCPETEEVSRVKLTV